MWTNKAHIFFKVLPYKFSSTQANEPGRFAKVYVGRGEFSYNTQANDPGRFAKVYVGRAGEVSYNIQANEPGRLALEL